METHEIYVQTWRERLRQQTETLHHAEIEAGKAARQVAARLVNRFGAHRVYLIGSPTRCGSFHETSDIDLAVEGLAPARYTRALSEIIALAGRDIDLVPCEDASPEMKTHIRQNGIILYERAEIPAPESRHRPGTETA